MKKFTNKLFEETSPYLLQHAHNPVNWYPWSEEALELAKKEDKPILISIGYSACHWCHVMERESFEDEETAEIMNKYFINIKIDREERPDLDHIYMDAVQAMAGNGGWPLNVFLTPDKKPFFGGTYFPPKRAFNRSSWQEVLLGVQQAFAERRQEIESQAENLTEHLLKSNSFGINNPEKDGLFSITNATEVFHNMMKSADKQWGGFGKAPKFPQTFVIQFLLRYYHVSKNEESLVQGLLSIDKMIDGGIYDQLGGGFARYSTDAEWLAPHFEKMLYDNALLISVISEAYQLTKNERYREIIEDTIGFIKREMMQRDKGFFSALDADSEGVEGKFYVWSFEEIKETLGEDHELFCNFFDISVSGNWENNNILWRKKSKQNFCKEYKVDEKKFEQIIKKCKSLLLNKRSVRVRPVMDDKILLGWNSLMNSSLSRAYAATGIAAYKLLAIDNMNFLLKNFSKKESTPLFHSWKNGKPKFLAFLDDYAFFIQSLILLQEITGDTNYLIKAKGITEFVIENFKEDDSGFFFYTEKNQLDVIVRKKEVYDGAQPSGNAVMAENLYKLSAYFDIPIWKEMAVKLVSSLSNAIVKYPSSFGVWNCLFLEMIAGTSEIAIIGDNHSVILEELLEVYMPHKIVMSSHEGSSHFPLLADKQIRKANSIFLCRNYACQKPVETVGQLLALI